MKDIISEVSYQKSLTGGYYRLGLKTGLAGFSPGQFGMLQVPGEGGVLLRRPFSLARQLEDITEILYKAIGMGTRNLSRVQAGEKLKLLAPLGRGFAPIEANENILAVAGGYGVAPFWQMGSMIQGEGHQKLRLCYGVRSQNDIMLREELNRSGIQLKISTQDGSEGFKGLVTELVREECEAFPPTRIVACGPMGMLKAVGVLAQSLDIPSELSVEEAMGCGTGVCLGCVVMDKNGHYRRSCVEGPVFKTETLELA